MGKVKTGIRLYKATMFIDCGNYFRYIRLKHKLRLYIILLLIAAIPFAAAFCDDWHDAEGLAKTIISWFDIIFGNGDVEDAASLVNISFGNGTFSAHGVDLSGVIAVVDAMHGIMAGIGSTLIVIFFLVGIMEDLSFNQMFAEKFARKFIFLFIAAALVTSSKDLVFGIANIGSELAADVAAQAGSISSAEGSTLDDVKNELYESVKVDEDAGFTEKLSKGVSNMLTLIGFVIDLIVPFLISKLCWVIIYVMCWSRLLEILMLAILSPVMVADVARGNGMQSSAIRGVKNVFALSISGAIIILALYMGQTIAVQTLASVGTISVGSVATQAFNIIIIRIVQTGLVIKSGSIAKQALGMV